MNSSHNPYTVPDGYFGRSKARVLERPRTVRNGIIGLVLAATCIAVMTIPVVRMLDRETCRTCQCTSLKHDSLAQLYEQDVFLQVNF